jgi:hypothetical protein
MSCEHHRSEIREVALGTPPSRRLEAHLASCPGCRALLNDDRRRLAEFVDDLGKALAVAPSPSLLPRVREVASRRLAEERRNRSVWLLPVAASIVALAVLIPLARRARPVPGPAPVPPSSAAAIQPTVSEAEVPLTAAGSRAREDSDGQPARVRSIHHPAAARPARAASAEPEVIVPPGGEAAFRRYVQAIRHSRVVDQVVLGPGPDPVDWTEPASMLQQPRAVERFPAEMEPPTAETEALTLGD